MHHAAAAERHRHAAHGPRLPAHAHGRAHALASHARLCRAVAAGHRSRRHRHPDGGGAPARGGGQTPSRPRARQIRRARLAVEGGVRQHDHPPDAPPRHLGRLVARPVHHGSGPVARGHRRVRAPARRRPDLSRQAPRQLGPGAADRRLGPGSAVRRRERQPLAHPLPASRRATGARRRRHHASRDLVRRYRRGREPRRRALPRADRQATAAAAHRPQHPGDRRQLRGRRTSAPAA